MSELDISTSNCTVEQEGHILLVTLNRPEKKNAFTPEMLLGMYRAWRELDEDPALRVAILTGRGDVFCAGADLKAMGGDQRDEALDGLAKALAHVRERWEPETTANNLRLIRGGRARRGVDCSWLDDLIARLTARA